MNKLQEEVLRFFGQDYEVVKEHEDGDLTILSGGVKYIITTEGEFFMQIDSKEEKEKDWGM